MPADANIILKERYYKINMVRFFCSGSAKIIFILLTKAVIHNVANTPVNVKKCALRRCLKKLFTVVGLASIIAEIISCIFLFVSTLGGLPKSTKTAVSTLKDPESGAGVPKSLSEFPKKDDGHLDRVEFTGLIEI